MAKEEPKVVYVKHPITAEQKAGLRAEGARIVDAKFAPEDAEIIDLGGEENTPIPEAPEDIDKLKKDQVIELLQAHGVENPTGKVDELKAALKQAMFVGE